MKKTRICAARFSFDSLHQHIAEWNHQTEVGIWNESCYTVGPSEVVNFQWWSIWNDVGTYTIKKKEEEEGVLIRYKETNTENSWLLLTVWQQRRPRMASATYNLFVYYLMNHMFVESRGHPSCIHFLCLTNKLWHII